MAVILSNVFESRFPQAGRADFGICFIVGALSQGWANLGTVTPVEPVAVELREADAGTCVEAGDDADAETDTGAEAGSDA